MILRDNFLCSKYIVQQDFPSFFLKVFHKQFQEFYDTYGIKEGDGMYLAPEDRVAVW